MVYYDALKRIEKQLIECRKDLEDEIRYLPEGDLYCYKANGIRYYSERVPQKGNHKKEHRYGVSKDRDRLYSLVRKEYAVKAIDLLEKDIRSIQTLLKRYKPFDENSVMKEFVEKHPELTEGIYYGIMSDNEWAESFVPDGSFRQSGLKSLAADGSMRRSLGEIIIGSRLKHYGIAFKYEAPINHPDLPYVPDFTIMRPRDKKIIYWEHLGMVNNDEYMRHNYQKLNKYEEYGIVPWDNLIVSYSNYDGGINEKLIDSLIHGWLL